jgi:ubiquinone/menaquinone biosynthesis C-methylase UbiE
MEKHSQSFSNWYNWTDQDVLEKLLMDYRNPNIVIEVASGPNIAIPFIIEKKKISCFYISIDLEKSHINLQKKGIGTKNVEGLIGDASNSPLINECVDIFVFHHAIDDIIETKGFKGLYASLEEAIRVLKKGGCMIFSHCIFSSDPFTKDINLSIVQSFLEGRIKGNFRRVQGSMQDWLFIRKTS